MGFKIKTEDDGHLFPICVGNPFAHLADFITLGQEEAEHLRTADLAGIHQRFDDLVKAGNEEAKVDLAVALALKGDMENALKWLRNAVGNGMKRAHYPLGRLLFEYAGQLEGSEEKKVMSEAISNLQESVNLDPLNAAAFYYLGAAILKLDLEKDTVEAFDKYKKAGAPIGHLDEVEKFLKMKNVEEQRKVALDEGRKEMAEKNYSQSIDLFQKAIELGEERAYYFLGRAHQERGDFIKALDAFYRARTVETIIEQEKDLNFLLGQTIYDIFSGYSLAAQGVAAFWGNTGVKKILGQEELITNKMEDLLIRTMDLLQQEGLHPSMLRVALKGSTENVGGLSLLDMGDPVALLDHHILLMSDPKKADFWILRGSKGYRIKKNPDSDHEILPYQFERKNAFSKEEVIRHLKIMARWQLILNLNNPLSSIEDDEFEIALFQIEEAGNLEENASATRLDLHEPLPFRYKETEDYRGMQLCIRNKGRKGPGTNGEPILEKRVLHVTCLFLGADFLITDQFLAEQRIDERENEIWMTVVKDETQYRTIPLYVQKEFLDMGVNKIHEYIKVILSLNDSLPSAVFTQQINRADHSSVNAGSKLRLKDWLLMSSRFDWVARTVKVTIENST